MPTNPQGSSTNPTSTPTPRTSSSSSQSSTGKDSEFRRDTADAAGAVRREGHAASEAIHDATDAVRRKASHVASEAKASAKHQAETMQGETSETLHVFADAARGASNRLKERDHGTAARLVHEAASGLDHISASLRQKRLEEVAEDVRTFGRQSPTAFIAASVLAGIALGRFMRSSTPDNSNDYPKATPGRDGLRNERGTAR